MKCMSIGDENMDKYMTQHLPQTKLVACPHATQYLCNIQLEELSHLFLFILLCKWSCSCEIDG